MDKFLDILSALQPFLLGALFGTTMFLSEIPNSFVKFALLGLSLLGIALLQYTMGLKNGTDLLNKHIKIYKNE